MSSSALETPLRRHRARELAEVWAIAWPTVIAMTSYTVMQFVDKLMVGQVGPVELAAQGIGGMWSFGVLAFLLGILTVINTYVSQNLGAGTPEVGPRYAWAGLWFSLALWLLTLIPYGFLLPYLFALLEGHTPELRAMETGYAQILTFGSIFLLTGRCLNQFFFGLHRPHIVTVASICGNLTNIVGNYILIFGHQGIPALGLPGVAGIEPMGVYGAAIATVIGSAVEMLIPFLLFVGPKLNAELRTRAAWRPDPRPMRDLLRTGWPAGMQWGNELICWALFMGWLIGHFFGDNHITAATIGFGYMSLSFMPALGFSVAANSLVGKYIGAGLPEIGAQRARLALLLSLIYMTICGAFFLIFREQLIGVFLPHELEGTSTAADRAEILRIGSGIMILIAFFQTADALGVVYSGALRGAGDTVWPGVLTFLYSWIIIIGLGYALVVYVPHWGSVGPWLASAIYIIIYGVTMAVRFESGRWKKIRLLDHAAATHANPA